MTTIRNVLNSATQMLAATSSTPRLDAELLLCQLCSISREQLVCALNESLTASICESYQELLHRRLQHEPIAYIIGRKEFWGLQFDVSPAVLIPRPETELLVERGLELLRSAVDPLLILDLGTGSGCIAIALGNELMAQGRRFMIIATDRSREALVVARRNIIRHDLSCYIKLLCTDWLSAISSALCKFNLIISNPPYVAEGASNLSPELCYEPRLALFAADGGVSEICKLVEQAMPHLQQKSTFLCEVGIGHSELIEQNLVADISCTTLKDLFQKHRVVELRKPKFLSIRS